MIVEGEDFGTLLLTSITIEETEVVEQALFEELGDF